MKCARLLSPNHLQRLVEREECPVRRSPSSNHLHLVGPADCPVRSFPSPNHLGRPPRSPGQFIMYHPSYRTFLSPSILCHLTVSSPRTFCHLVSFVHHVSSVRSHVSSRRPSSRTATLRVHRSSAWSLCPHRNHQTLNLPAIVRRFCCVTFHTAGVQLWSLDCGREKNWSTRNVDETNIVCSTVCTNH